MNLLDDFLTAISATEVTAPSAVFKLFISLILGGIVGMERKRKGQVAGIRTFALISMGATLAMLISIYIPQAYLGMKNGDPGRIAAQVVTGVGFLGAGAIIQTRGSIRGLTTAAGIWMVAAIGMSIGVGMYLVSVVATFFILFILVSMEHYEHRNNFEWRGKIIRMNVPGILESLTEYKQVLKQSRITVYDILLTYDYEKSETIVDFIILAKGSTDYVSVFRSMSAVNKINNIALRNDIN